VPTTRTVSTTSPLTGGGALSSDLTLAIPQASGSVNGYLGSTDFATFNAKQNAITLTTTGTSGAATLVGSTLNIPNYADTDTGITSLNGLTALTQTFAVGTSGTDFGISSATSTHTFNLPTASAANRGALSSADWTTFNNKQNALTNPITGTGTTNYLPKFTGASALGNSLVYDSGSAIGIGTTSPNRKLTIEGTSNAYMSFNATSNRNTTIGSDGVGNFVVFDDTFGDYRMVIKSDGNVGIGTTTPSRKLSVSTTANAIPLRLETDGSNTGIELIGGNTLFNFFVGKQYNVSNAFEITPSTTAGGTTFSTPALSIQHTGAATFSSSVTAAGDIQTNGTANKYIKSTGFISNQLGQLSDFGASDAGYYIVAGGGMQFVTNGTDRMRIEPSGNVQLQQGLALSGATAPASGIEFPATQVASASANNLDDYEEGTWTMGVAFGGASVGVTYSNNTGSYTKIGRQVTVTGLINLSNKGTSIGNVKITGLPFSLAPNTNDYSAVNLWLSSITFLNQYQAFADVNLTTIQIFQITNLGTISNISDANFSNTSQIIVSLTYFV
jgi:hypothetical protein